MEGRMKRFVIVIFIVLVGCERSTPQIKDLTEAEFQKELSKIGVCVKLADNAGYTVDKERFNVMFNSFNFLRYCQNSETEVIKSSECSYRFSKNYKKMKSDDSSFIKDLAGSCKGAQDNTFAERNKECLGEAKNTVLRVLPLIDEEIKKIGGAATKSIAQEKYAAICFGTVEV